MTPVEQVKDHFYSYAEPHIGPSEEPRWIITEEEFEAIIAKAQELEQRQDQLLVSLQDWETWKAWKNGDPI